MLFRGIELSQEARNQQKEKMGLVSKVAPRGGPFTGIDEFLDVKF